MIGVVVPFSRPKFRDNVLKNFGRQIHQEKILIVVENGRGMGVFNSGIVVRSDPDRSSARNVGIQTCRDMGISYWAIMEDDDWYGSEYLSEVWEARNAATITGKWSYYQQDPEQTPYLKNPGHCYVPVQTLSVVEEPVELLAATLAGWTHATLPFRPEISYNEELIWYIEMQVAGHTLFSRGSDNFILKRYSDPEHRHAVQEHGIF